MRIELGHIIPTLVTLALGISMAWAYVQSL
jgi:hypothetical protein